MVLLCVLGMTRSRSTGPSQVPEDGAVISVTRRPGAWADVLRSYRVVIDGRVVGRLRNSSSGSYAVSPGRHQVFLRIDWTRSRVFNVDLAPGETASFSCGSRNPFTALYFMTIGRDRYIKLDLAVD